MSAIFGMLRLDSDHAAHADLERMSRILAHRGPDAGKVVLDGSVGLGNRLLRVNREDRFEAQPLVDRAAGLTLVADCRIDNRETLAADLGLDEAALADMPDSALVLAAYKAWGDGCAARLLGDFAFAVWDERAQILFLARDHMGQRGFFYHLGHNAFTFASELKALWALDGVPRQMTEDSISQALGLVGDPNQAGSTGYEAIFGLPGGSTMTIHGDGRVDHHRYWDPRVEPAHQGQDEAYYVRTYRALLTEAIECRLRRLNQPAALMLSGGLDSAAIAGLAQPLLATQNRNLIGLSVVVGETWRSATTDIRPWVEACARVMPRLETRYIVDDQAPPFEGLEQQFLQNDGRAPANHQTMARLYAEARKSGSRLLMDGMGGDYTVHPRGYGGLARLLRLGRLRDFIRELGSHVRMTGQSLPSTLVKEVLTKAFFSRQWTAYRRWRLGFGDARNDMMINRAWLKDLMNRGAVGEDRPAAKVPVTEMRARIAVTQRTVANLALNSMTVPAGAHGLDFTRPFHDRRIVEFALAVPEDLYVRDGRNRYLAFRAMSDVFPPEFRRRGRANQPMTPNIPARIDKALPEFRAETERLRTNPRMARYLDFDAIARALSGSTLAAKPKDMVRIALAIRGVLVARRLEWFDRRNTAEPLETADDRRP